MVLYQCIICGFETKFTTNYKQHLKTKKHLSNVNNNDTQEKTNLLKFEQIGIQPGIRTKM